MTTSEVHTGASPARREGEDGDAVATALPTLSVSVVTYHPDLETLRDTLESLRHAARMAQELGVLGEVSLDVVDNGTSAERELDDTVAASLSGHGGIRARVVRGHGNVGYGRGHNLSLLPSASTYHLVLNPDVIIDRDGLVHGIRFLEAHGDVGMVAPHVRDEHGTQQFLCRAYPTAFILFLRGFAPRILQRVFRRYMHAHELRDRIGETVVPDVPLISGCFMLGRRRVLHLVGGFSPDYFMYFEDSDLSLKVGRVSRVAYAPAMRIVHFGGGAARKGLGHVRMFVRSAATFFRRNGWRFI